MATSPHFTPSQHHIHISLPPSPLYPLIDASLSHPTTSFIRPMHARPQPRRHLSVRQTSPHHS
ncbi:hypothetical protein E2C01_067962 [Portunus trituberculatus]|uniref:Uncharacterized protein n=1 Tax=Portunus trituberculatus TaxID=210409 RepID=A0A5B7HWM4_PORTR|nr:hypothetical protein [Portunus trituberculatus]